ncbi:uncharacterized protein LOC133187180 [Saccostrea echinata]|uniref:uncharacterized protein LOC133187180 n=1 Tax=Saccostrea echinata TaxID=191078 RepID=UPI002A825A85|nr:uncharacterized protein LOC133187180 [Saccostrea echinata]
MKMNVAALFLTTILCTCAESYILQEQENQPAGSSNLEEGSLPMEKRGRLSLTADLRSLARMLEAHRKRYIASRSPYDSIRKKLFKFGKRTTLPERQLYDEGGSEESDDLSQTSDELPIYTIKRQRLSVNGALSSLADMLAASGRQRMRSEMEINRQRLFGLGK